MNKLHDKCSLTYVFQPWSTLHPVAQWWAAASWISFHKYEILLQFAYCSNYIPQIINNLYFIQKIKSHYSKQNRESGTHPQKVASQNISVSTATSTAAAKPIQPQALHSLPYHCFVTLLILFLDLPCSSNRRSIGNRLNFIIVNPTSLLCLSIQEIIHTYGQHSGTKSLPHPQATHLLWPCQHTAVHDKCIVVIIMEVPVPHME